MSVENLFDIPQPLLVQPSGLEEQTFGMLSIDRRSGFSGIGFDADFHALPGSRSAEYVDGVRLYTEAKIRNVAGALVDDPINGEEFIVPTKRVGLLYVDAYQLFGMRTALSSQRSAQSVNPASKRNHLESVAALLRNSDRIDGSEELNVDIIMTDSRFVSPSKREVYYCDVSGVLGSCVLKAHSLQIPQR